MPELPLGDGELLLGAVGEDAGAVHVHRLQVLLGKEVQQLSGTVGELEVHLLLIQREELIEIYLIAAGEGTDRRLLGESTGVDQHDAVEAGVFRKGGAVRVGNGMAPAQPAVLVDGQAGQDFQPADGPVPRLALFAHLPVGGQADKQLSPLQLLAGQILRHVHGMGPHAVGHQDIVVLCHNVK